VESRVETDVIAAFGLAFLLAIGTALLDDSSLATIMVPIITVVLLYAMWKAPLRVSIYVMMFCAFTLENPADLPAAGNYKSPLFMIGAMLLTHLNTWTGLSFLVVSGLDVLIIFLFIVVWHRRSSGSTIDRGGAVATPKPLVQLAYVSIAGSLFVWGLGLLRGGNNSFAVWQIDRVIHLPLIFLLCHFGLRGPKDYAALARTLLVAAVIKACFAVYVMQTIHVEPDADGNTSLAYATTHHDSILFATAVVLIMSLVIHRAHKHAVRLALLLLPVLVAGMVNNGRRMVWVQIGLVFLTVYVVMPMTPTKRKLQKILLILAPFILVYVVAGWGSSDGIFKPVATIRSVVDPASDGSTMTREIEDFDLIYTIRAYPLFGTGYGNPYWQVWPLPFMGYDLELYCPHNSILGMWTFCGYIGYSAMTLLWCAGVHFAMRAYHASKSAQHRAAAMVCYGSVLIYLIQCWGDMGLGSWIGVFTLGPALALSGKLAVVTGAWSLKPGRRAPAVVAEAASSPVAAS
jgi:hypothetical protein